MSESIQLLQPVTVKVIMTAEFRAQMIAEVERSLTQLRESLSRLELIGERADEGERLRIQGERARLHQAQEELQWRIREAQSLQDGAEVFYQNVTSCVTVKVGDSYLESTRREILVKDGQVVAIRSGSKD